MFESNIVPIILTTICYRHYIYLMKCLNIYTETINIVSNLYNIVSNFFFYKITHF